MSCTMREVTFTLPWPIPCSSLFDLPLPVSVGASSSLHHHCTHCVVSCHSWWMLLWKLSYPKSMLAQKEATGMCLNKNTCIFLALGATVNSLAKNMDECLYPFKYHHQATREPNIFAAVVCFFCMCFIREIVSLGWSLEVRGIKERRCLRATVAIILWVISVNC